MVIIYIIILFNTVICVFHTYVVQLNNEIINEHTSHFADVGDKRSIRTVFSLATI